MRGGKRVGSGRPKIIEQTLEEEYADDPVLLNLYKKKLRKRGWAGAKSKNEVQFLRRISPAAE